MDKEMKYYFDITHTIDWISIKMTGVSVTLCAITGGEVGFILGIAATTTTIIYNGIRIYKELRKKNKQ